MRKVIKRGKMRRGQVTLFVILGIIVLFIVGFLIYFNYRQQVAIIGPERSTVSEQFEPVQLFVEDCMESVARDAVERLGKHGGYIDPNDAYLSGRVFFVNPDDQTESDLAYLSEDEEKAIAYWYYSYDFTGCDNCLIMSQAPYLDEIERQISIYVSENINSCLGSLERFRQQGYDMTVDELMYVKTTIRDEDILLESIYPINITYQGSKASMERYVATLDIPLLKYYEMAMKITAQEYNSQFLEGLNSYLLLSYSGLDSELLPPLYAYSSEYSIVFWSKSNVKNNMRQLLISYVPLMQVVGAKNYNPISNNNLTLLEKNFIDLITIDLFPDRNLESTEISFIYTGQELAMEIQPSKEELLGPFEDYDESGSYFLAPPEKSNSYQFFYDISYPVIVEIKDEYKPGQYYTFMFALESNIKQNLPLKEWWNATKRPLLAGPEMFSMDFNDPLSGHKITDPRTGKKYTYKERTQDKLFCRPEVRTSGEVYLKTYDAETKQPLPDVYVRFGCGNYAVCEMGKTTHDDLLDVESFNQKLPICMNGYIQLSKYGYKEKNVKLTTTANKINLGSIYLEPIKKVNVSVEVYPIERKTINIAGNSLTAGLLFPNTSYPPAPNDTIMISITRITSGLEEPLSETVFISPDENNTEIELIPGRYILSGKLMTAEGYIIPKECKEVCNKYFLGVCTSHKKVPEDNIPVKPALMGGIDLDATFPFIVKREHLENNTNLTIYLLKLPPPPCIDEMQEMNKLGQLTMLYRTKVMPQFK